MRRHPVGTIVTLLRAVTLLFVLLAPLGGSAQPLTTADLAGDWFVSQVTAPTTAFTGDSIRSYRGTLTFSPLGAASGTLTDDLAASFTVSGTLTLTAQGLVDSEPEDGYYASPDFPRTVTSHTLPGPVPVGAIEQIYISFKDTLTGNFYVTTYRAPGF